MFAHDARIFGGALGETFAAKIHKIMDLAGHTKAAAVQVDVRKGFSMKDRLLTLITEVIQEMNETREERISTKNLSEVGLYGDAGVFDSMHLVSFLAKVEEKLEDEFDVEVSLTSEKAVSMRVSPFSSVRRLIAFIEEEIQLANGGESGQDAVTEPARQAG